MKGSHIFWLSIGLILLYYVNNYAITEIGKPIEQQPTPWPWVILILEIFILITWEWYSYDERKWPNSSFVYTISIFFILGLGLKHLNKLLDKIIGV